MVTAAAAVIRRDGKENVACCSKNEDPVVFNFCLILTREPILGSLAPKIAPPIEATETSTDDATTQPTLTTTALADGSWLIFNVNNLDGGGTAAGCHVNLIGYQT